MVQVADDVSMVDRVLDGAERAFARFGVRACTIEHIGREAGVSRMTVYRHGGQKDDLFRQVVVRGTRSYFHLLETDFAEATSLEDVVLAVFRRAQDHYRSSPLYQTLLRFEPEQLLRILTVDSSGLYEAGVPFLAGHVAPHLADAVNAEEAAEWIVRVAISVVGSPGHHALDPYDPNHLDRLAALTAAALSPKGAS